MQIYTDPPLERKVLVGFCSAVSNCKQNLTTLDKQYCVYSVSNVFI